MTDSQFRALRGVCSCCQRVADVEAAPFGKYDPVTREKYIMSPHRVINDDFGSWCEGGESSTITQPEVFVEVFS